MDGDFTISCRGGWVSLAKYFFSAEVAEVVDKEEEEPMISSIIVDPDELNNDSIITKQEVNLNWKFDSVADDDDNEPQSKVIDTQNIPVRDTAEDEEEQQEDVEEIVDQEQTEMVPPSNSNQTEDLLLNNNTDRLENQQFAIGERVLVNRDGLGQLCPARIINYLANEDAYDVEYEDGDFEGGVSANLISKEEEEEEEHGGDGDMRVEESDFDVDFD